MYKVKRSHEANKMDPAGENNHYMQYLVAAPDDIKLLRPPFLWDLCNRYYQSRTLMRAAATPTLTA